MSAAIDRCSSTTSTRTGASRRWQHSTSTAAGPGSALADNSKDTSAKGLQYLVFGLVDRRAAAGDSGELGRESCRYVLHDAHSFGYIGRAVDYELLYVGAGDTLGVGDESVAGVGITQVAHERSIPTCIRD